MNKLYEVIGIDQKTKIEINAFVIAASEDDAIRKCNFLINPQLTGRVKELSPFWQNENSTV